MRILIYNFLQPEEPGGGGVGVYINNLAKALVASGRDVITLSSGSEYAALRRKPYLVHRTTGTHTRAVIVNSPIIAPALYSFDNPGCYISSADLDFVPQQLYERFGNIDVFHFHNIEGLTLSFFTRLRRRFPNSQLVYSAHNYHPLCSKVDLWYQDRTVCNDFRSGDACTMCGAPSFDLRRVRATLRLRTLKKSHPRIAGVISSTVSFTKRLRKLTTKVKERPSRNEGGHVARVTSSNSAAFLAFRDSNVKLLGSTFDKVLAVSHRTRDILVRYGVPANSVAVSYIGTVHKAAFLESNRIMDIGAGVHLCYMGYMWRNKGFEFFLESLEQLPNEVASQMSVTIAAKNTNAEWYDRVVQLTSRFRELRYFDGYTHQSLNAVLSGVNLGIVPVLWEDNLPQIAIELISKGIPILTSDRGGAKEIAHNEAFIYRSGNHDAFAEKLADICSRRISLAEFWTKSMRLYDMGEHLDDLEQFYFPARN